MSTYVLIANQKGGVGKTTIADELAFSLERRGYSVGFQNLDNQGGTVHSPTLLDDTEDFVVIDTPGALTKDFKKTVKASDIVLMPTHASKLDLIPLLRCWEMAEQASKKTKLAVVMNRYDARRVADQDFVGLMEKSGMPIWGYIPAATAFVKANAQGISVWDVKKDGKAARAIEQLAERVIKESK